MADRSWADFRLDIDGLKDRVGQLSERFEGLKDKPEAWRHEVEERVQTLRTETRERLDEARTRVEHARDDARVRAWALQVEALEATVARLDEAVELPVVGAAAKAAVEAAARRLTELTEPSIDDYDSLNAKTVVKAVSSIDDPVELEKVARHEAAHKDRKTVKDAIDKARHK